MDNVLTLRDYNPKKKDLNRILNRDEARLWFNYLCNLYLNMYEWKGMPESVNLNYLEELLLANGQAIFVNDPNAAGYMCLQVAGEGNMNVYFEYTRFRAIGNGYSEPFEADDCVWIRDNQRVYPPILALALWARKISDAGRTIDVYQGTLKRPWLITTDESDKLTYRIIADAIQENEAIVIADKRINSDNLNAIHNKSEGPVLLSLWRHKNHILDECLTWLGVNNANTDKRERLITDEVEANNQLIQLNNDIRIDWRRRAADDINKKFGLNVSVALRHDYIKEMTNNGNSNNDTATNN